MLPLFIGLTVATGTYILLENKKGKNNGNDSRTTGTTETGLGNGNQEIERRHAEECRIVGLEGSGSSNSASESGSKEGEVTP